MKVRELRLAGVYEVCLEPRFDNRGYFMRMYDERIFQEHGFQTEWVQENQSLSTRRGTIRGLHFQRPPKEETKLVRVIAGAIFDVFVDLRRSSLTYGQWDAVELAAEDQKLIYIPKGFAHGFCTVVDNTIVSYRVDAPYSPESEGGLCWDDADMAIAWPTKEPILSERDCRLGSLSQFVSPFE